MDDLNADDPLSRLAARLNAAVAALEAAEARRNPEDVAAARAELVAADAECWEFFVRAGTTQPEGWRPTWRPWSEVVGRRARRMAAWHRRWATRELQTTMTQLVRARLGRQP